MYSSFAELALCSDHCIPTTLSTSPEFPTSFYVSCVCCRTETAVVRHARLASRCVSPSKFLRAHFAVCTTSTMTCQLQKTSTPPPPLFSLSSNAPSSKSPPLLHHNCPAFASGFDMNPHCKHVLDLRVSGVAAWVTFYLARRKSSTMV